MALLLIALIVIVPRSIVVAFLIFSFIVLVHEFGHFIVAKKSGIFVEEFAIGMGPKLISVEGKETVYSIRILPIGGFCKMLGEDEDAEDERAFNNKSVWARIATVFAGPLFNFILVFLASILMIGIFGYTDTVIMGVSDDTPAQLAGLQSGDEITKIDNKSVALRQDISLAMIAAQGNPVEFEIVRDGETFTRLITPEEVDRHHYRIGINLQHQKSSFIDTIQYGAYEFRYWARYTMTSFRMLFSGEFTRQDVAGPVGIVNMVSEGYEMGSSHGALGAIEMILTFIILISFNLGVVNLIPIPALDGGRLIFLIIEGIRGKPINREAEGFMHFVGFALLMALMVFLLFNDISNFRL